MILNALLAAIATTAGAAIALAGLLPPVPNSRRPAPSRRLEVGLGRPALGGLATAEPHTAAPSSGSEGIARRDRLVTSATWTVRCRLGQRPELAVLRRVAPSELGVTCHSYSAIWPR